MEEVQDAVRGGYASVEDVKRYTGLATGTCQGRLCLPPTLNVLVQLTGRPHEALGLIRFRPPVQPVPLGILAAGASPEPKETTGP